MNAAGQLEGYEIFLKYLPAETTEESLRSYFAEAGTIVGSPRLLMDPRTNKCKGVGWITFSTVGGMNEALSWDGCSFGGRNLSVTAAKQAHVGVRPTLQAPGTHTPALLSEVVEKLVGRSPGGTYVDATFGRGGHSRGILDALSPAGRLHAFDMDPEAVAAGKELAASDSRFTIHHAPFGSMASVLGKLGVRPAGVFFDLGISSPQFDEAHRGFRPEADGPLDLRFDPSKGEPAWQFLQSVPRRDLARLIGEFGETTDAVAARRIADAICLARDHGKLPTRTREFAGLVAAAKGQEYQPMHPAKLTFQALRIHLNDEFGEMRRGMRAALDLLDEGGRIGLITWKHSECAIVVDFFREHEAARMDAPLPSWYAAQRGAPPLPAGVALTMDDVTRPSERELRTNSRSRSALLHVLRKKRAPTMAALEALAHPLLGWAGEAAAGGGADAAAGRPAEGSGKEGMTKEERREAKRARRQEAAAPADGDESGRKKKKKKKKLASE